MAVCLPEPLELVNVSQYASTFQWDFGDGSTSTAFEPTHPFGPDEDYIVSLLATSDVGCRDTISKKISAIELTTAISSEVAPFCKSVDLLFFNDSEFNPGRNASYVWTVNGDTISTNSIASRYPVEKDTLRPKEFLVTLQTIVEECVKEDSEEITIYPYIGCSFETPNAFNLTREINGRNDYWLVHINDFDTAEILSVSAKIFSENTGQIVFSMNYVRDAPGDPMICTEGCKRQEVQDEFADKSWKDIIFWDGRENICGNDECGILVPAGRYYYEVEVGCCDSADTQRKKGILQAFSR